ncbi:MAG TPA: methyltransferase domain-containing protein, partial [Mycobacterium sp.]|nr:methyltransferase domain-containing protein [Mycobacterium sp.]
RHGGDSAYRERLLTGVLYPIRDQVLDMAQLQPGDTLLDVGAGDGLIALSALDRVGPSGHVIFSDISQDLLDRCQEAVAAEGAADRCSFVRASADALTGIADASVDVVTTRSVLIYVKDKAAAFREFSRVLRPGGRVSLFEPINRLMRHLDPHRFLGYNTSSVAEMVRKIRVAVESLQPSDTDPMLDFDERDLLRHAEDAGFPEVRVELQLSVKADREPLPWETLLRMSGNPKQPPLGEVLREVLTEGELAAFTTALKPVVESGNGQERSAYAYLTAIK